MSVDAGLVISIAQPCLVATSVYLAGRRDRLDLVARGWLLGLVIQVVFAVYAVVSRDWGWALGLVLVAPFFTRNWWRARREVRAACASRSQSPASEPVA